jgi:hypothetical protein
MLPIETAALLSFVGLTILRFGVPVLVMIALGSLASHLQTALP